MEKQISQWISIGGLAIYSMDTIQFIESFEDGKAHDNRGSTVTAYSLNVLFTDGKKSVVPVKLSHTDMNTLVQSVLGALHKYQNIKLTTMQSEIDELRQMIIHLPQVGKIYLDSEQEFKKLSTNQIEETNQEWEKA